MSRRAPRNRRRVVTAAAIAPIFALYADQPSTIATSGTTVTAWGAMTAAGAPQLIPDTVTGLQAVRFDTPDSLSLPAGKLDCLSQTDCTVLVVWRQRRNTADSDHSILDSSANGTGARGYQLIARDKRASSEYRQVAARIWNGTSWVVDHASTVDPSGSYGALKWNVLAATTSATRGNIEIDGSVAYNDTFSVTLPAGAPGAMKLGGSQIDVMAVEVYCPSLTDSARATKRADLARRFSVDTVTLIAGDGYTVRNYGFPSMGMANGKLICVYRNGVGHGDDNGWLETRILSNGTWSAPVIVYTAAQGSGNTPFDPNVCVLSNGNVLISFFTWDGLKVYFIRSTDNGSTWAAPQRVTKGYTQLEAGSAPIVEKGTKLYLPVYTQNIGDAHSSARVYVSSDGGATWPTDTLIANGIADARDYQEPGLLALQDGSMFALVRTSAGTMYETTSADAGVTWAAMASAITSASSAARLIQFASGRIAWLGRPGALLVATIYHRLGAGSWTTVNSATPAPGIDATDGVMIYGAMIETSPGVASIIYAPQIGNNPNVYAEVLFRTWPEWQLDGKMPITLTPSSATVARLATRQFTVAGAGNFTWSLAVNASGGSISASGLYTAGNVVGSDTVRATDLNNGTKDAVVTVT